MKTAAWILVLFVCIVGHSLEAATTSPQIVRKVKLLAQTSGIGTTTLATPTAQTLYRISVFWDTTVPLDNGSYWCFQVNWTDNGGAQNNASTLNTLSNAQGTNNYSTWTTTVLANAGTAVTYSVLASGSSDACGSGAPSPIGSTYELFFTVEKLE